MAMGRGVEREVKLRVPCEALAGLAGLLESLGARVEGPVEEVDVYYRHPCRDFASTDEALRLRVAGGGARLTYKGPRLSRGPVKERLELEASVEGPLGEILEMLGFREAARVVKRRLYARLDGHTVTLDQVEGLGCFVEVEGPDPEALADRLGLGGAEMVEETYLEMVLRARGPGTGKRWA